MKKYFPLAAVLALAFSLVLLTAAAPAPAKPATSTAPAIAKKPPGVELAQAISMITGVAISPLLGVGAVGAWKYFQTPLAARAGLPWFAEPWFWATALALVTLVFIKDTVGVGLPALLKKPLDVLEMIENKLSALVVAGAFIPFIALFSSVAGRPASPLAGSGAAVVELSSLQHFLFVPFALVAFGLVWIAAHAINILIVLSPFGIVDAALKSFRLFLLATVAATSFLNPYLGAFWSLLILVVAYFVAGWAFRLTVFGSVFAWDLLSARRHRFSPERDPHWMFLARAREKAPIRSYGILERDAEGARLFRYRPWLVLPERTIALPAGEFIVGRGLFHAELLERDADETRAWLFLPPRYRSHEETLARAHGFSGVEDIGLKAAWKYVKELVGFKRRPALN